MNPGAPCGVASCPVTPPSAILIRRLRTHTLTSEEIWWRGASLGRPATDLVPGLGDSRFAPLPEVDHMYLGATRPVALLESALHETTGPVPTIYRATLAALGLTPMRPTQPLRLADLRDSPLARLGIQRRQLVATGPAHYACTRVWASRLQAATIAGDRVDGAIWHSRQAELHADGNPDGLAHDLLRAAPVEVVVVWSPHAPSPPVTAAGPTEELLSAEGAPARIVLELSALIGAPIE